MSDLPPSPEEEPVAISADMLAEPEPPREQRVDFEKGMPPVPSVAAGIIVLCVAVFAWEWWSGALASAASIIAAGALHRASVLEGEVWRLLTAIYLHGSPTHLLGNCMMLYVLGMGVQHGFGWARTLLLYHVAGLCGSILSVVLTPGPGVGASGAIFGLSAAIVVFFYRFRHRFFLRDKRIGFVPLVWAMWSVGTGFLDPTIDNYAHIGGFVGGALMAAVLPARPRAEAPPSAGFVVQAPGTVAPPRLDPPR
jgi:rhomboid protease GluP